MRPIIILAVALGVTCPVSLVAQSAKAQPDVLPYAIVDTGQTQYYDADGRRMAPPMPGDCCHGQDAQYSGRAPAYRNNGNGTVTDLQTGLMWTHDPGPKRTYAAAVAGAPACRTGGHADWRLPSIKELYSLILFSGTDPDPRHSTPDRLRPFIDTDHFAFQYGKAEDGDRIIDAQFATSTLYRSTTMFGMRTMFGVNFADGRIKGYPIGGGGPRPEKLYYTLYVRGNPLYGRNAFQENGDGTVTDTATGLTWMQADSGNLNAGPDRDGRLTWQQALDWAETLDYAGHTDWRLPDAKELQSIVDYTRCPDITQSPAIDPVFRTSPITNEGGKPDFPSYWTSTTHATVQDGRAAVYLAFGRGLGWMQDRRTGEVRLLDVHGAGCQRSDPKSGDPRQFPRGRGPQGDVVRILNHARCVRGGL